MVFIWYYNILVSSSIDVFHTLNLSVFIEITVCCKCLSWTMDFWALFIMYYTKGRKLLCYTRYVDYIVLNSYVFFFQITVLYGYPP